MNLNVIVCCIFIVHNNVFPGNNVGRIGVRDWKAQAVNIFAMSCRNRMNECKEKKGKDKNKLKRKHCRSEEVNYLLSLT